MSESNVKKEPSPQANDSPVVAPDTKRKREYKDFGHDDEKPTRANVDTSSIELKAEDLDDEEKVDLETIAIEDVFKLLQCGENGLSSEEAQRCIDLYRNVL